MGEEEYAIPSGNCKKIFFFSMLTSMWIESILKKKKKYHYWHLPSQGWITEYVGWNQLGFHISSQKMIEGWFGVVCSVCNSSIFFLIVPAKTCWLNSCSSYKIHWNKRHTQVTHSLFWKSIGSFDKIIIWRITLLKIPLIFYIFR